MQKIQNLAQDQGGRMIDPDGQKPIEEPHGRSQEMLPSYGTGRMTGLLQEDFKSAVLKLLQMKIHIGGGEAVQVVKIADFGVARVQLHSGVMTAETGTYRWMAPEVIEHKPYNHKADVFSFGVVLWELLTGKVVCSYICIISNIHPSIHNKYFYTPYAHLTPLQTCRQQWRCPEGSKARNTEAYSSIGSRIARKVLATRPIFKT
ncbi:hypothetical protein BUALT_Bualt08G0093000 [Buddleja alternifolia]|uniref:Protein kinase domain-containing protein n=1 Tax=Buddleja alternifolia TaxID=168488 RepID=A0AAV6XD04_9LAMI|nr:hypothetical protein BUALT_Bualt08G0093000 [Buddleja alternifolia]